MSDQQNASLNLGLAEVDGAVDDGAGAVVEPLDVALGVPRVAIDRLLPQAEGLCVIHEPPTGFEPATIRLQGGRSTD